MWVIIIVSVLIVCAIAGVLIGVLVNDDDGDGKSDVTDYSSVDFVLNASIEIDDDFEFDSTDEALPMTLNCT